MHFVCGVFPFEVVGGGRHPKPLHTTALSLKVNGLLLTRVDIPQPFNLFHLLFFTTHYCGILFFSVKTQTTRNLRNLRTKSPRQLSVDTRYNRTWFLLYWLTFPMSQNRSKNAGVSSWKDNSPLHCKSNIPFRKSSSKNKFQQNSEGFRNKDETTFDLSRLTIPDFLCLKFPVWIESRWRTFVGYGLFWWLPLLHRATNSLYFTHDVDWR